MDTFETELNQQDNAVVQETTPSYDTQTYTYIKKSSPFVNSPYESSFDNKAAYSLPLKKTKTKNHSGKRVLTAILAFVFTATCCIVTGILVGNYHQKQIALMQVAMDERLDVLQAKLESAQNKNHTSDTTVSQNNSALSPSQVYEKTNLAVVEVSTKATVVMEGTETAVGSMGTGFIISNDGYIVSNYHVIQGAETITINTGFGKTYEAEIVGFDADNDFSLLKIDDQDLPCINLGNSDDLVIGEQVVAIGYPLDSGCATLTVGYISAKDRIISTDGRTINMLQTDAAINSGNSGGPLLNMYGEVVGITTAKSSGTSSSGATIEGVGYAIPVDDIIRMISDLQEYGYITGAYLGIWVRDVDATAQSYGLPAGAYVEDVMDGYAAQRAGIQSQDIIVNIAGYDVTGLTDLTLALRKLEAGQTVTVTVYRGGREVYLSITLDEKPQETPVQDSNETETEPSDTLPENQEYPSWNDFWDSIFKYWAD